jgi:serine/threonine protein kinase
MFLTNSEFFREAMYYTDEVKLRAEGDNKFVNEFLVCNNIGRGSYSKVKRVLRLEHGNETLLKLQKHQASISHSKADQGSGEEGQEVQVFEEDEVAEFAMKMMHKPTLRRERAIRYNEKGEMQMINNLDKVYSEIEIWTQLNHPYIAKLYEMIDDDNHDYLYLILEIADLGQIAVWDFKQERYVRNQAVFDFIVGYLE